MLNDLLRQPWLRAALLLGCLSPASVHAELDPATVPPPPKGVTVLIIRHAEKQADGPGLSKKGFERVQRYVRFFENLRDGGTSLKPDAFYAARDTENSFRPRLTLDPVARAFGLPLNVTYKVKDTQEIADLLRSKPLAGRTALLCWHHGEIPDLLIAFGLDPKDYLPGGEWPDKIYNWLIELHVGEDGTVDSCKVINEELMPWDVVGPPPAAPKVAGENAAPPAP